MQQARTQDRFRRSSRFEVRWADLVLRTLRPVPSDVAGVPTCPSYHSTFGRPVNRERAYSWATPGRVGRYIAFGEAPEPAAKPAISQRVPAKRR